MPCIWHGPYFYRKAGRIHGILERAFADSGGVSTSLEHLYDWSSERIRTCAAPGCQSRRGPFLMLAVRTLSRPPLTLPPARRAGT